MEDWLFQQVRRPGDANEGVLNQPTALGVVPSHKSTSGEKEEVQRGKIKELHWETL